MKKMRECLRPALWAGLIAAAAFSAACSKGSSAAGPEVPVTEAGKLPSLMVKIAGFAPGGAYIPVELMPKYDFMMCKYEVTQALWEEVTGSNPSEFKGADRPVENVSLEDCLDFIAGLNALPEVKKTGVTYRLPTAGEWDYACQAGADGTGCRLADGTEIDEDTLTRVAWFEDNSGGETHPVGQKEPNAFGLYDMQGNVWEWTSDKSRTMGNRPILCGGAWNCPPLFCGKPANRDCADPEFRSDRHGFRLVSDCPKDE